MLTGQGGVGKTSIAVRYIQNYFTQSYDPSCYDDYRKRTIIDGEETTIDIFDSYGEEEYQAMSDAYIRVSDGNLIVLDLNNFQSLDYLHEKIDRIIRIKDSEDMTIIFVLNKIDLINEDNQNEIVDKFTNKINGLVNECKLTNTKIMKCSAKSGEGIADLFVEAVRMERYGNQLNSLNMLKEIDQNYLQYLSKFENVKQKQKCKLM